MESEGVGKKGIGGLCWILYYVIELYNKVGRQEVYIDSIVDHANCSPSVEIPSLESNAS